MVWPYVLLGLAILAVWLPAMAPRWQALPPAWVLLFLASVASALFVGVLDWRGALVLALFAAVVRGSLVAPGAALRGVLMVAAGGITLALPARVFPGFHDPAFDVPIVRAYGLATAGLFLLVAYAPRVTGVQDLKRIARPTVQVLVFTIAVVLATGLAIGFVRFDPRWPENGWIRTVSNLLFICVAEEAFFRGLLQDRLSRWVQPWPVWRWMPVVLVSVLFGLAHAGKGPTMAGLATLAGLGYGWAYARTGRIEPAILTHFAVNTAHYFLFPSATA